MDTVNVQYFNTVVLKVIAQNLDWASVLVGSPEYFQFLLVPYSLHNYSLTHFTSVCKKLVKCFAEVDVGKYGFFHSVVRGQDSLPNWVVKSISVHFYKINIDKFSHDCDGI